jgi:hypothetical protein
MLFGARLTNRYLRQSRETWEGSPSYRLENLPVNPGPTDACMFEVVRVSGNGVIVFRELYKTSKLTSNTGTRYPGRGQQNFSKPIPGRSTKCLKSSSRKASRQKCPTLGSPSVLPQICHLQPDAAALISAAWTVL